MRNTSKSVHIREEWREKSRQMYEIHFESWLCVFKSFCSQLPGLLSSASSVVVKSEVIITFIYERLKRFHVADRSEF